MELTFILRKGRIMYIADDTEILTKILEEYFGNLEDNNQRSIEMVSDSFEIEVTFNYCSVSLIHFAGFLCNIQSRLGVNYEITLKHCGGDENE